MQYDKLRIKLEKQLGEELYQLMQGDVIEEIIREAKIEKMQNAWKSILEGHSFKLTKKCHHDCLS